MARTRPGTDREFRFTETEEPDDTDEDDDGDDDQDAGTPPTSLDDLTTEADPQQFDQTFIAGDASLTIQGRFDPVAGARQVIPRVAYVLSYNLIYSESRDRWEPQKKSDLQQAAGTRMFPGARSPQSIPPGTTTQVDLNAVSFDNLDAADTAADTLNIPADGLYLVLGQVSFVAPPDGTQLLAAIERNGSNLGIDDEDTGQDHSGTDRVAVRITDVRRLAAGDALSLVARQNSGGSLDISDNEIGTFLIGVQLGR